MGMLGIPYTIGMALGQVAGGYLYDWRGDYVVAFCAFAAAFVFGGAAISLVKPYFLLESRSSTEQGEG
jgi:hypothetical protein